jgi:type I restriction enzyme S subunit
VINDFKKLPELPKGWIWTIFGNLFDVQGGSQPPKELFQYEPQEGYIRLLQIRDFGEKPVPTYVPKQLITKTCKKTDVLIARYGASLGRIVTGMEGAYNVALAKVIMNSHITYNKYIFYLLKTPFFQTPIHMISRSAQNGFNKGEVFPIPLPLPPFAEQQRIVAKIEELFTELDAGVDALKKIQVQLKHYRQSALKYAFGGKLTEEWRKKNQKGYLHADEVLKIILNSRQIKWRYEELKTHSKLINKYKEPSSVALSELPTLPLNWTWASVEQLAEPYRNSLKAGPFGSSLKKEYYVSKGYKIYGQEQVIRQNAAYGNYYIDTDRYESLKSCTVKPGDILISLVGTIGKILILPDGIEQGIINPRLVKLSLDKEVIESRYFKFYIESSNSKQYFSISSHGGTMDILNLNILKSLPVPIPPLEEQLTIVSELERQYSIADEIEQVIELSLRQSERLRRSILKTAFEGKLVPQNPNDEPAERLLERIKGERAQQPNEVSVSKRRSPKQKESN